MPPPGVIAPLRDIGMPDLTLTQFGQALAGEWWETSADLIWPTSVITYGRMRHDTQLKAVTSAYFLPLLRANWLLDPAGCRDEVVQQCSDDMGVPIMGMEDKPGPARRRGVIWHRHLRSALPHLIFGHMPFELRYILDGQRLHLDNLGERMPWTIAQIKLNTDATINHVVQTTQRDPIPGNRLVWYVNEREGANWAGFSMFRPAYGAWLLKHETWRVHATSIRRFGMGVPTVEAPPGGSAQQVTQAQAMASAMRAGDQTGAGLPNGFKFALTGLTGSVPDALAFIEYLDRAMAKMVLAGLIELGQTEHGSRALGQTFLDLFLLSLQAVGDEMATVATSGHGTGMPGIVTDLVDVNWGPDEPAPRLVCTDVGENYEVTAEAIFRLVQCGAVDPDPELDAWARRSWRIPLRSTPWEPSSKGIPAPGAPVDPNAPPGSPATLPTVPPTPSGAPAANHLPGAPGVHRRHVAASGPLRRQMSTVEAASGFQPAAHQAEWDQALGGLLTSYAAVVRAQRTDLVDQVIASVEQDKTGDLAALSTGSDLGAQLIQDAMASLADSAALRMVTEAASQGVDIDMSAVAIDTARLATVASTRATLAAASLATLAGGRALQVAAAGPKSRAQRAAEAGDLVDVFLTSLSPTPLRDQLMAALSTAQIAGRVAVLAAAPESAGQAVYTASEILDSNTCGPCLDVDGEPFGDLAAAEASYPTGGFISCEGFMRCRGTVVAVWGGG